MSNEYYDEKRRKRKSEIIKGLVFLVAFFAILYGYFIPVVVYESSGPIEYYTDVIGRKNSPKLSGTVYLKNVPMHLEGNTGFTQYDLDKLSQEVPDILLQNCNEIYMCYFNNPNSICYQLATPDTAANIASYDGFTIWDGSGRIVVDINSYNILNSIIHELIHLFDEKNNFLSQGQSVLSLYNQYAAKISNYAKTNSQEFLAESGKQYFLKPEKLQRDALPVYDYFQSLFHYYS